MYRNTWVFKRKSTSVKFLVRLWLYTLCNIFSMLLPIASTLIKKVVCITLMERLRDSTSFKKKNLAMTNLWLFFS
jgi:hypothetical protein